MSGAGDKPDSADGSRMTLIEHLEELRRRIVYSGSVLLVATVASFALAPRLFDWLRLPLESVKGQKLITLGPLELFMTYLKISILAAVFATAPWILYQAWQFVAPGLYRHEKRWIVPFVGFGTVFFAAGGAFSFLVVLPYGFQYLVQMAPATVETQYSVSNYFSFVIQLTLAFGLVFELPLIMWVLAAAGIVAPKTYSGFRKYWIVLAFIIGGVLTPPDPFSQFLMAIPLLLFFELGILGARMLHRRRQQASATTPPAG
ncbi:MAG: twin-arginine translocase subunit TatC [Deltaproteobacteria bacterium]|nr:twin-arginine translocase subunit TatC [Deltaproteobacteria bacterium]